MRDSVFVTRVHPVTGMLWVQMSGKSYRKTKNGTQCISAWHSAITRVKLWKLLLQLHSNKSIGENITANIVCL